MADFTKQIYAQQSPKTPDIPPQYPPLPNIPAPQGTPGGVIAPFQNPAPYLSNASDMNLQPAHSNSKMKSMIIFSIAAVVVTTLAAGYLFISKKTPAASAQKETSRQLTSVNNSSSGTQDNNQTTENIAALPNSDPDVYSNSALGISLKGPQGWEKAEGQDGILVIFRNPLKDGGANSLGLSANLSLIVESLDGQKLNLDQYAKSANALRTVSAQNYVLLGSTKDSLGGEPAVIDDYTMTVGSLNMRQRQVYTIKNGYVYLITFSADPPSWNNHLLTFDTVRSTFKFTGIVSGAKTRNAITQGALGAFLR